MLIRASPFDASPRAAGITRHRRRAQAKEAKVLLEFARLRVHHLAVGRMLEQLPHGQCLTGGPVLGYGNLDINHPSKQRKSQLARAVGATEFRP